MSVLDSAGASGTVAVDIWIDALPDRVFAYFTDPEKYQQWMDTDATIDPVPGGELLFNHTTGKSARGTFLELFPPDRLSFTWGWDGSENVPPGSTRVDVRFVAEARGTRVYLIHSGIGGSDLQQRHRDGWVRYLGRLGQIAGSKSSSR